MVSIMSTSFIRAYNFGTYCYRSKGICYYMLFVVGSFSIKNLRQFRLFMITNKHQKVISSS